MTPRVSPTAPRWRPTIAALAATVAVWLAATPVEASLPPPPFAIALDVSPGGAGNRVTVRVEPQPGPTPPDAFDLYVVQLQGFQQALFLTT